METYFFFLSNLYIFRWGSCWNYPLKKLVFRRYLLFPCARFNTHSVPFFTLSTGCLSLVCINTGPAGVQLMTTTMKIHRYPNMNLCFNTSTLSPLLHTNLTSTFFSINGVLGPLGNWFSIFKEQRESGKCEIILSGNERAFTLQFSAGVFIDWNMYAPAFTKYEMTSR